MLGRVAYRAALNCWVADRVPAMQNHRVFVKHCWNAYGTGRTRADAARKTLDFWFDTELLEDLHFSDLDVPVLQATNRWPLPWPEFNRRAGVFLRRRFVRKAVVRGVSRQFSSLDAACRDALNSIDCCNEALRSFHAAFDSAANQ